MVDNRNFREDIPVTNQYFDKIKHELSSLPKENNVVTDGSLVEFIDCSICGDYQFRQLFVKYGFIYAICESCSHVYVKNRLNENIVLDDYKESKIEDMSHEMEKTDEHQKYTNLLYQKYLNLIVDLGFSSGNLIDVGCGTGKFVSFATKNSKFNVHGLELNESQHLKLRDILGEDNLSPTKIENASFGDKKFKIITFWGVLEHLLNPISVLNHPKKYWKTTDISCP